MPGRLLLVSLLLGSAVAAAHHSLPVNYRAEEGATVQLDGTLVEVDWRNPHMQFSLAVSDADGGLETWRLESYPASYFEYRGFERGEFAIGSALRVEIYPARDAEARRGWARTVRFASGRALIPITGNEESAAKE